MFVVSLRKMLSMTALLLGTTVLAQQNRDLYKILGVKPNATPNQIKSAYKKLSKEYHPDRNPSSEAKVMF
jgi:DnaJ-domain-containing protein 1